ECSGTVVRRDANLYYLYSTNRILKSERTLQAFFEMISDTQIDVFSGIATAYTVFQAELTAEQALQRALQEKHSNVCLLNEVGQIKGPFFEYSTTLNEPSLKTGLA